MRVSLCVLMALILELFERDVLKPYVVNKERNGLQTDAFVVLAFDFITERVQPRKAVGTCYRWERLSSFTCTSYNQIAMILEKRTNMTRVAPYCSIRLLRKNLYPVSGLWFALARLQTSFYRFLAKAFGVTNFILFEIGVLLLL